MCQINILYSLNLYNIIRQLWASLVVQMGKESACNTGDVGSIPGLRRSPGEGNGYPLEYSCLENFMDRGAHRVTQSRT